MSHSTPTRAPRSRIGRIARWLAINAAVTAVLLLVVEGLASFAVARRALHNQDNEEEEGIVAERRHTEYDPLLGWINLPNMAITNMYGEGRDLFTNARRMRDTHEVDPALPPAGPRIIVSGDSFSFGYGVGNQDTWAEELERLQGGGLEVLNMAQGGYGLDQAFLWYERDGQEIPHDLHIMAFITEDFRRMTRDNFMGYGKPVLSVSDGALKVGNVPPPRGRPADHPLRRYAPALQNLRIVQWFGGDGSGLRAAAERKRRDEVRQTAGLVFRRLQTLYAAKNRAGVLVYLPIEKDHFDNESDSWREWLADEAESNGWIFVDLVRAIRHRPRDEVDALYIPDDHDRYRGAKGHFTEAGNKAIAYALWKRLLENPGIARRLNKTSAAPDPDA